MACVITSYSIHYTKLYDDFTGDIALLHLTSAVDLSPIPLADANAAESLASGTLLRAYGWGVTTATSVTTSDTLQQVDLPYVGFNSQTEADHFLAGGNASYNFV